MHWPSTPVEYRSCFQPPFCPWRDCAEHARREPGYRFRRHGHFATQQRRRIPRFRCLTCRRTFSRQTFAVSYYCKRPELLGKVAAGLVAGSAFRQLARSLECGPTTVARISARLGRHAMLLHAKSLEALRDRLTEPIVFDHFETFEFTQDLPFGIGTSVGSESWFVYGLDPAPHGRAGRLSAARKRRLRSRPKRALHGRYRGSTRRALDGLLEIQANDRPLDLLWDGHADYARVVATHPERERIRTRTHPNPRRGPKGSKRSREAIERDRAMFPVDLLHKILRHSLAHHRRETIAFSRRLNAAMERMALTAIWRNFVKKRSERRSRSDPPAMILELTDQPWSWSRVLSQRLFFDRVPMPDPWPELYRREWITPVLASNARHALERAF